MLANQAEVADQERRLASLSFTGAGKPQPSQDPCPRLGLKVVDLGQGEPAASCLGDQQPGQRVLAGLLGRGGQAENFVLALADISSG